MKITSVLFCLFFFVTTLVAQEKRMALLIGNGDYSDAPLNNPENDARALGKVFKSLQFQTTVRVNKNLRQMNTEINSFCDQIRDAKRSGQRPVVCFYFSGHGMQINGVNYLMPVNTNIADQGDVQYEAYPMDRLLQKLENAGGDVNIVLFDACRNNPFERKFRGRTKDLFPELNNGLAEKTIPTAGTLIAYATSPGRTADDGFGKNSPYAAALLKHLPSVGLTIEQVLRQVRNEVYQKTNEVQIPWESSSLMGADLILKAGKQPIVQKPKPTPKTPDGMVFIQGGSFDMGDTFGEGYERELPVHKVTVPSFYMGRYEITIAEFKAFIDATNHQTTADKEGWSWIWTGSEWKNENGVNWQYGVDGKIRYSSQYDHPVIHVSWYDAVHYCNWRSQQDGLQLVYRISGTNVSCDWRANGYRLPTEAEWEYAAREGGKNVRFGNGKNIADAGEMNFDASESYKKAYSRIGKYRANTTAVGSFSPNGLGLYDMSGNVWEWCWDRYASDYYKNSDGLRHPKGAESGSGRVMRGGSWRSLPVGVWAANRNLLSPASRYSNIGFRLTRTGLR